MAYRETGRYCPTCERQVLAKQETPNHVLHFLITFFTCGLWGLMWIIIAIANATEPWKCPTCGSATRPRA